MSAAYIPCPSSYAPHPDPSTPARSSSVPVPVPVPLAAHPECSLADYTCYGCFNITITVLLAMWALRLRYNSIPLSAFTHRITSSPSET
ncbi:hypothetical protein B0H13DRAFT_2317735 [Mycena leptocephala]|nr:hypothetical protein B0H13DRAFT_2317735 [Mycena leptocephala]